MHQKYQYLFIISGLILVFPILASAESNIDFFFKTSDQYKDVVIKRVVSTDTVVLKEKVGEKGEVIKLIGLRAPDVPKKNTVDVDRDQFGFVIEEEVSPLTPIEERAFDFVTELLEGQRVRLEFDAEKRSVDGYGTMAYVFLLDNDTFVNAEILRQGFANLQIRPPNTKYAQKLRDAYKEARTEKRGLQGE